MLPRRGVIALTVPAVHTILRLPNKGYEVKCELDVNAINFINEDYGIDKETTPRIDSIVQRVKANKTTNDDFLRS